MELAELNNKTAYPIEGLKAPILGGGSLFLGGVYFTCESLEFLL